MIRSATESEIPRLVEMGLRFHNETAYKDVIPANPEQMGILGKQLLASDGLVVSERDGKIVGMIGFVLFPHFLSGEKVAGEVFWWVEPEHRGEGLKLLVEAEKRAIAAGAKKMQMIAPNAQVANVYERLHYTYIESAYQKDLVAAVR